MHQISQIAAVDTRKFSSYVRNAGQREKDKKLAVEKARKKRRATRKLILSSPELSNERAQNDAKYRRMKRPPKPARRSAQTSNTVRELVNKATATVLNRMPKFNLKDAAQSLTSFFKAREIPKLRVSEVIDPTDLDRRSGSYLAKRKAQKTETKIEPIKVEAKLAPPKRTPAVEPTKHIPKSDLNNSMHGLGDTTLIYDIEPPSNLANSLTKDTMPFKAPARRFLPDYLLEENDETDISDKLLESWS